MDNETFYKCWKYIEKKAFFPGDSKDINVWLDRFVLFFYNIYELGTCIPNTFDKKENKFSKEITFIHLNTRFKFIIKPDISSFSLELKWEENNSDQSNLHYEYDSKYRCEWDYLYHEPKRNKKNPNFSESELKYILEHMIVHPAIHCHVFNEQWKDKIASGSLHEIRLGMPTTNPFLFLYQVSFQFLSAIAEQKKENELKRLTKVIWDNKDKMSISPGLLFSPK
jgi:hypothetical protein